MARQRALPNERKYHEKTEENNISLHFTDPALRLTISIHLIAFTTLLRVRSCRVGSLSTLESPPENTEDSFKERGFIYTLYFVCQAEFHYYSFIILDAGFPVEIVCCFVFFK